MAISGLRRVAACALSFMLAFTLVPAIALAEEAPAGGTDATGAQNTDTGNASEGTASDNAADKDTTGKFVPKKLGVKYRVDTKASSWSGYRQNSKVAGKAKWNSEIERVQISAEGPVSGGIEYRTRVAGAKKWSAWSADSAMSGTDGKPIEAIQMRLTGELAKKYSVYYRAYSAEWQWLGWASNGQTAGTKGYKYPLGAIRIVLKAKDAEFTGTTKRHSTTKKALKGGTEWTMNAKAQKVSSKTKWLIMVNRSKCTVGIFKGKKGAWKMKKYFLCDVGKKGYETPKGTFKIGQRFSPLKSGSSWEYYAIRVTGNIHFHSILFYPGTHTVKNGTLGKHISHGCIRLAYKNAKWMYKNLPDLTSCKVY